MTQIKVETTIYYFNNKYNGGKESDKINERVERIKVMENTRKKEFLSFPGIHITGDEKHFYRLSKWLPLIFLLMNINGSNK